MSGPKATRAASGGTKRPRRGADRGEGLVVFCGPSISHEEAQRLAGARARILPPARQGDVYACLSESPRVIALIDGVFESVPSVWHRELIAALEAGVRVFGASSMGALRAAELRAFGMVGVGRIFERVRAGEITDDAEVALLHAGAEHGFRAMTVPLVTAVHALDVALSRTLVSKREHASLVRAAQRMHYQRRSWGEVLAEAKLGAERRTSLLSWLRRDAPDLKREDARECIAVARGSPPAEGRGDRARLAPTHARIRQLLQSRSISPRGALAGVEVLEALSSREDAHELEDRGTRRLALAALARGLGFQAAPGEVQEAIEAWLEAARLRREELPTVGLDEGQLWRIGETIALERKVLDHAERLFPDGPSALEGLAFEARSNGLWSRLVRERARES